MLVFSPSQYYPTGDCHVQQQNLLLMIGMLTQKVNGWQLQGIAACTTL